MMRTGPLYRLLLRPSVLVGLALLAGLLLLGCEESVDARLELTRPFSIWGMINPKADTHAVRVFEIQSDIRLVQPEPIDATVTSTRMQSGEAVAWQDSVVQLFDGDYRHVYWSTFHASEGDVYRLEVTRSDGATTSAEVKVPPPISLDVLEPDTTIVRGAIQPILIRGAPPALPRIDVEYIVTGIRPGGSAPVLNPITFNYVGTPTPHPEGWLLEVDLFSDFQVIFETFDETATLSTEIINLLDIDVRVHVGDENWISPIGVFDAELLVEPGTFTNVDNGFGFFGAGYVESITFRPPFILLERAGFDPN